MTTRDYLKAYRLGPKTGRKLKGAVILHGLTGVPWDMLPLGQALEAEGFSVDLPVLQGHGEGVEGVRGATLEGWRSCLRESAETMFALTGKPLTLCGLSMGGLLCLDYAIRGEIPVACVVSLAAPLDLGPMARGVSKLALTKPWANSWTWPKVRGSDIENKLQMPGADAIPFTAVGHLQRLIEDVREGLPDLTQPLLVMQGANDHTSPPESPWEIIAKAGSSVTKLVVLKRGFHIITRDVSADEVNEAVVQFATRFEK